jgi:ABC-type transport system involved in multi-copper enzyme maturation permease subunit
MKYLAILKDSVREAMDTSVFYVMAGLSALMILVIASISFKPVSVEEDVKRFTGTFNWMMSWASQGRPAPRFAYEDFRQTNAGTEPWKGDYTFTLVMEFPDEEVAKQVKKQPGSSPRDLRQGLRQQFSYLDNLEVAELPAPDPKELRWAVSSHGTKIDNVRGWKHEPSLFFGGLPLRLFTGALGQEVYRIESTLVNGLGGWIGILVGIVVTAFFIPNMLRKGTVDLLLVKPIRRPTLLVFKYLGGISFMFLNTAVVVGGIWLVLGLRSGIWAPGFLLSIPILTFFFAILYSVSTLAAVLTRSPVVAIMATVVAWAVLFGVGLLYSVLDETRDPKKMAEATAAEVPANPGELAEAKPPSDTRPFPDWLYTTGDVLHYVLPRTGDLNTLTSRLIKEGVLLNDNPRLEKEEKTPFTWGESLTVSGIFIAVMLGLACVRFATKDY